MKRVLLFVAMLLIMSSKIAMAADVPVVHPPPYIMSRQGLKSIPVTIPAPYIRSRQGLAEVR